ncbi:hypothetical protein CK507_07630 [Pseudomonas sp. WN033]|nr:hypothetical protein CK507_07630 [Pseudomonas sp. WN033]
MNKLIRIFLQSIFLMVSFGLTGAVSAENDVPDLEKISKKYNESGCPGLIRLDDEYEGVYSLISMDEMLVNMIGGEALTNSWFDNLRVTQLTRPVNENYLRLKRYALRDDVKKLIEDDWEAVQSKVEEAMGGFNEEVVRQLSQSEKFKKKKLMTLQPLAQMSTEEYVGRLKDEYLYVLVCRVYEMAFVEGSKGDELVGNYLRSVARTALPSNINRLMNLIDE